MNLSSNQESQVTIHQIFLHIFDSLLFIKDNRFFYSKLFLKIFKAKF